MLYQVGDGKPYDSIKASLDRWTEDKPSSAVIEITNSGVYMDQINVTLEKNQSLQLRAANHTRPVICLPNGNAEHTGFLGIKGAAGSRFKLDGLLISGQNIQVQGPEDIADSGSEVGDDMCEIVIRHCTLVPGLMLQGNCRPWSPGEPSLELINTQTRIKIEKSILALLESLKIGSINRFKPVEILISDSILDAMSQEHTALGGSEI
jgi:hypothetical protein